MKNKKIEMISKKKNKNPLVCLTAYSKTMAKILDKYCDIVLVGDSLGMVLYGMKSTRGVTLDMMINHARSVKKGISKSRHLKKIRNLKKRGRTTGSKKGAKYSRITKKRLWIIKIRAIRRRLKIKKDRNEISNKTYWDVYKMAGSGQLRNVKHMEEVVNSKQ